MFVGEWSNSNTHPAPGKSTRRGGPTPMGPNSKGSLFVGSFRILGREYRGHWSPDQTLPDGSTYDGILMWMAQERAGSVCIPIATARDTKVSTNYSILSARSNSWVKKRLFREPKKGGVGQVLLVRRTQVRRRLENVARPRALYQSRREPLSRRRVARGRTRALKRECVSVCSCCCCCCNGTRTTPVDHERRGCGQTVAPLVLSEEWLTTLGCGH